MKCPTCGTENPSNARFCGSCRQDLGNSDSVQASVESSGEASVATNVGFGDAIKLGFSRYAQFSGRSSRAEYWWWALFVALVNIATTIVDAAIGIGAAVGVFGLIWTLAVIVPSLALTSRRLHDVNRTGWWQLGVWGGLFLFVIPGLVIGILLLIWVCTRSNEGDNKYGPSPI